MIYEWTPTESPISDHPAIKANAYRNYGDSLIDVILTEEELSKFYYDDKNCYSVLGSTICNTVMEDILREDLKPIFINCGWRGEELDPYLLDKSEFLYVRGPRTQKALDEHGINVSVEVDPAYNIINFVPKGEPNAQILFIPHLLDPYVEDYDPMEFGADTYISPGINNKHEIIQLTKLVSGARFVFTGSMHAAIVAHAYGVPFGLFNFGYVDCPPKWKDWGDSVGINEFAFFDNVQQARDWHRSEVPKFSF